MNKSSKLRALSLRSLRSLSSGILLGALLAASPHSASAASVWETRGMFDAFKNAFYVDNGGSGYFKIYTAPGSFKLDFWKTAECIEMVEDYIERTGDPTAVSMLNSLLTGFVADHGSNWAWNNFNDDVMWATIAYARAYRLTGNATYRNIAKSNYDMAYARAWDAAGGGGFFWNKAISVGKNSAVNFPATIAAYYIYLCFGDASYLTKAQANFAWGKANLWNSTNGNVYDSTGDPAYTTYNQGTFIGAAHLLGDVSAATLAANFMVSNGSIDPASGLPVLLNYDGSNNNDAGGFNGIAYRWISKFMADRHLQSSYLAWLENSALLHFNNRRSDHLSWCKPLFATPATGDRWAFECMSAVSAIIAAPATYISNETYILRNRTSGLFVGTAAGGTANNTAVVTYSYNGNNSMKWNAVTVGTGQYRFNNVASGRALSVQAGGVNDGDAAVIWDWFNGNQQKVTITGKHGAFYNLVFVHSGKSLCNVYGSSAQGTPLVQWTNGNSWNNQFSLWRP